MPLPVDIDVGEANTPATGAPLRCVPPAPAVAGRPAQRAAEDAWLAPHRTMQDVAQLTRPAVALGRHRTARAGDLPFWAWVLGMASVLALVVGGLVLWLGAALGLSPLIDFGIWTTAGGALGFVLLVLRSNHL